MTPDAKKVKQQGQKKKKGPQGSRAPFVEIDFNLTTFLHNNLPPASDPWAGCGQKALNCLYGNDFLSVGQLIWISHELPHCRT